MAMTAEIKLVVRPITVVITDNPTFQRRSFLRILAMLRDWFYLITVLLTLPNTLVLKTSVKLVTLWVVVVFLEPRLS